MEFVDNFKSIYIAIFGIFEVKLYEKLCIN